jgi:plastocyanin
MRWFVAGLLTLVIATACGSKPTAPSGPPVATNTITITSNGVSPKNVEISLGSRVMFVNNDIRAHNMTSDPHPEHTDCPAIDQAGFLSPGQSRETGNLVVVRTCGFHDHDNPDAAGLKGTITIK